MAWVVLYNQLGTTDLTGPAHRAIAAQSRYV
jgi:hypothetical protein